MIVSSSADAERVLELKHKLLIQDPAAPLVYLVHGRSGNWDLMWTFRRLLPDHCNIIAPEAPFTDKVSGFSWWDVLDVENSKSNILLATDILQHFVQHSKAYYNLTSSCCLAIGFSQGAVLISVVAQRYPELFRGIALLAGAVFQIDSASSRGPNFFIAHGKLDKTVSIEKAQSGYDYFKGLGWEGEFHQDNVGHKVGTSGMRALKEWAGRCTL